MQTDCEILDEADSSPSIELSSKQNLNTEKNFPLPNHIWRGGYNRHNFIPPVYQYPFAEWVPNSIFYADYNIRSNSFEKWPKQMKPNKSELVKAGFFTRVLETVWNVFFVGISLHDWESKDNAIIEHKKWSPHCKFVDMISYRN